MAITRAQQAKQMLQEGGRIGFKEGRDTDYQQRGQSKSSYAGSTQQQNFSARDDSPGRDPSAQFKDLPPGYKTSEKAKAALEAQRQGANETIRQQREDAVIGRGPYELENKDLNFVERANRFGAKNFTNYRKNTLRNLIDYIGGGRQFKYPARS